jgi:hypothetical protein
MQFKKTVVDSNIRNRDRKRIDQSTVSKREA